MDIIFILLQALLIWFPNPGHLFIQAVQSPRVYIPYPIHTGNCWAHHEFLSTIISHASNIHQSHQCRNRRIHLFTSISSPPLTRDYIVQLSNFCSVPNHLSNLSPWTAPTNLIFSHSVILFLHLISY